MSAFEFFAAKPDLFFETGSSGNSAGTVVVPERTTESLALRDDHLLDPELLAKHAPWVVRGGSHMTGPWRIVSTKTRGVEFTVMAGWPEIQEALCIKLAALLNGEGS